MSTPPKVFISYSHDTVEHQDRVLGFANRLRANGIDAEIDQYNAAPPEGWPLWCERQITAADVVLMVCTETYYRQVSGNEERGKGLGVVWEAHIIRQLLYDAGAVSDKFVPILFSDASPEHIPTPIKGWTRYIVDTEDGYKELYQRLIRQLSLVRPSLGTIRSLPAKRRKWMKAQSEAIAASGSSSSAAGSPADRTVASGDNHGVNIGGNIINSAAISGDHNVTNINTASDNIELGRHDLQEFSQSMGCKTLIKQLQTKHAKPPRSKIFRQILLAPIVLIIVWFVFAAFGMTMDHFQHTVLHPVLGFLVGVLFVLIVMFFLLFNLLWFIYFILLFLPFSWRPADIYPALILEKHYTSGGQHNQSKAWHIFLEKVDGSRKKVVVLNDFDKLPGEIGIAVVDNGVLVDFK